MNFIRVRHLIAPSIDAAPTLALIVFAGWLAARWLVYFAAPTEPLPQPARERPQLGVAAQTLRGANLFGVASIGETVSSLNVKLRGVLAGGGTGTGYAILNAGSRDEAMRIGGEIVPGVTLEAVHASHIVVRRGGVMERVNLEERTSAQAAAARPRYAQATPPARRSVPAPVGSAAPPPPQSSGPGTQVRRPEPNAPVGDGPTDAQPPASASAPAAASAPAPRPFAGAQSATPAPGAEGLTVETVAPGSVLERLGLQPGDVVRSVNGEAVASEADVARVLQQRGMQGSFTAEVQRGGMTVPIAVSR